MKKYFEHMPDYMSNNLSHAAKVEMKRAHKHGKLMGMVKQKIQDFEDNYKDFFDQCWSEFSELHPNPKVKILSLLLEEDVTYSEACFVYFSDNFSNYMYNSAATKELEAVVEEAFENEYSFLEDYYEQFIERFKLS
tara:strand:- start:14471 stop:14878 length:408 start_codon:yes stop_codon:yes gene_type:complete